MNKAALPPADTALILHQLLNAPGVAALQSLDAQFAAMSPDLISAILEEAEKLSAAQLGPLNSSTESPVVTDGRVRMSASHRNAWKAFVEGGWHALDLDESVGGQGLALVLAVAMQEIFDRNSPAFGMLPVTTRAGARLLSAYGDAKLKAAWLPHLAAGDWTASICISEVGAGSDLGRMRTLAKPDGDGWTLSGEKQWISFGDHDLSDRIGHFVLARTSTAKGISLFLVPDRLEDGSRNGVFTRRIEEKMGLHHSPTCALGFEDAKGVLLGEEGRGLAQIFVMIMSMRLAVGATGLGIASGAADVALHYARDRKQGGNGPEPVPISAHADVQRQILSMASNVEVLRGLIYATAIQADLSRLSASAEEREDASALLGWLLPLVKTLGGETAFQNASDAIQVLGGAGYTVEWPAEQALRDARVLTIFEGTTGMQALDLLHRRLWRDQGRGLGLFVSLARADLADAPSPISSRLSPTLDRLEAVARHLTAQQDRPREAEAGANAFLDLAGLAARGWIAARLAKLPGSDTSSRRLAALGEYWLSLLDARSTAAAQLAMIGAKPLEAFEALHA